MENSFFKTFFIGLSLLCCTSVLAKNKQTSSTVNTEDKLSIVEDQIGIKPAKGTAVESLYKEAVDWLKTPYRYGGNSRKGIDCSAFTGAVYRNVFGVKLNRQSRDISARDVKDLKRDELQPGDLVFFATSRRKKGISHVGIYLGNNHFVHASTRYGVTISSLDQPFYKRTFVKGGAVKNIDKSLLYDLEYNLPEDINLDNLDVQALYVEAEQQAPASNSVETLLNEIPKNLVIQ